MSGFMATPVDTIIRFEVGSTPTTNFVVPFPFDDIGDLLVTVNDVPQIVTLTGTVETEGFFTAATVVLPAPTSNSIVYIQRRTQLEQEVKYPEAGSFRTRPLNAEISRLWMALQDTRRELDFSLGVVLGTDTQFTPNALVDTITNVIVNSIFPPGVVIGWAGFENAVPSGWELFMPMRDKFVVAAGPTRPNNTTGGNDVRTSTDGGAVGPGVTGGRALTIAQMPVHNHQYENVIAGSGSLFLQGGSAWGKLVNNTGNQGNSDPHDHPTPAIPNHNHQVTVVPTYYALAFIIRIGLVVATPPNLGDVVVLPPTATYRTISFAASDETTALVVATGLIERAAPHAIIVTKLKVTLRTASSSGSVQVNVLVNGVVMTASPVTLAASVKVANVTVLAITSIAEDALITVNVVAAGTGAAGLKVDVIGNATA